MFMVWQLDAGEPGLFCKFSDFVIMPVIISFALTFYLGIEEQGMEWAFEERKNERKTKLPPGHSADTVLFSVSLVFSIVNTHVFFCGGEGCPW